MDIHTDRFLYCESSHLWLVYVDILDMWLLLWELLCGLHHGLAPPQAVLEQLVDSDQSLDKLARYCAPRLLLPEEVVFLQ